MAITLQRFSRAPWSIVRTDVKPKIRSFRLLGERAGRTRVGSAPFTAEQSEPDALRRHQKEPIEHKKKQTKKNRRRRWGIYESNQRKRNRDFEVSFLFLVSSPFSTPLTSMTECVWCGFGRQRMKDCWLVGNFRQRHFSPLKSMVYKVYKYRPVYQKFKACFFKGRKKKQHHNEYDSGFFLVFRMMFFKHSYRPVRWPWTLAYKQHGGPSTRFFK